jgi:hypothetical protein
MAAAVSRCTGSGRQVRPGTQVAAASSAQWGDAFEFVFAAVAESQFAADD